MATLIVYMFVIILILCRSDMPNVMVLYHVDTGFACAFMLHYVIAELQSLYSSSIDLVSKIIIQARESSEG